MGELPARSATRLDVSSWLPRNTVHSTYSSTLYGMSNNALYSMSSSTVHSKYSSTQCSMPNNAFYSIPSNTFHMISRSKLRSIFKYALYSIPSNTFQSISRSRASSPSPVKLQSEACAMLILERRRNSM